MRELVVISGKGGTGKTSLTAAFASLSENALICDADVDASDLHLLTAPVIKERFDFEGGGVAAIDPQRCTECGLCRDYCRFDAIDGDFKVNPIDCEGCGVCVDFCPVQAIDFTTKICGQWFISETRYGPMVHARLGIAEENSGKLVTRVRQEAKRIAEDEQLDLIITDGPPGIGCPVIASIGGGAAAVLVVAEPTVSGVHDTERITQLTDHFGVPTILCVNKFDLNLEQTEALEELARRKGVVTAGRIPFDPAFVEAMVKGETLIEYQRDSDAAQAAVEVWESIVASPAMLIDKTESPVSIPAYR